MTIQDRFEAKVMADPNSGCWLWTANLQPPPSLPYGRFQQTNRKSAYAHRMAWELYRGPIPDGLSVLHKCDIPYCVNPDHLFLGTYTDNARDKEAKGRGGHPAGTKHFAAKLTPDDARNIRKLLASGFSTRGIAKRFQVHRSTILDIRNGRTWKTASIDGWIPCGKFRAGSG